MENMTIEVALSNTPLNANTNRKLISTPIRKTPLLLLGLALSLSSANVFAGDSLKYKVLSLDSAISLGLQHSKQIQYSNARVNESKASLNDLNNRIMPDLDVSAGYSRLSDIPTEYINFPGFPPIPSTALFPVILNNYSAGASLNESVFNGFQWKYAVQNMQFTEKSTEYNLESQKSNVSIVVIMEYINLYKLQKAYDVIEENLKEITAHVNEVGDFVKHGLATQNDLLRTQLQLSNAQLTELDIKNQIETLNFNLNTLLGLPENSAIAVDSNAILDNKTTQPLPYYLQNYAQNRNDLKALDLQSKAAEATINETKSSLYPRLSVGADYNYLRPNPRIIPPLDQFQPTWDIGVRISYSITGLYDNKNKTDVSRARLAEAKAQYDDLSDNAKMDINKDYLQYKESLDKIGVAQKSLEQAQENYKIVKSKYDNHIALLTDLLDADNFLLNARISLISSKADATLAYYSMLKSAGVFTTK
ncbi:MAG TPA: TolC family protein [Bacteroidia bacterium]|nr:TolC family protein [Bacteroidia bacterium]